MLRNNLAAAAYPVSYISALALFFYLSQHGYTKWWCSYLPIMLCVVIWLPWLERVLPYRSDWVPPWREVWADVWFTLLVQIALPMLLGVLLVFTLHRITAFEPSVLWPHHWPLWAQGVLMLLGVDFLRYWLHRWAHHNRYLWRLHQLHHAPDKLYWLNTSRFHPLEKVLHYCCDALPFICLGVSDYVLALYFVCYAVNGFYQHSNVALRLGWLSRWLSTAELHRWHHSALLHEANHNFGSTTIVWDRLFGTYYHPQQAAVSRVGI